MSSAKREGKVANAFFALGRDTHDESATTNDDFVSGSLGWTAAGRT